VGGGGGGNNEWHRSEELVYLTKLPQKVLAIAIALESNQNTYMAFLSFVKQKCIVKTYNYQPNHYATIILMFC